MGPLLMIVGGGLCSLAVLTLFSAFAVVVWQGERGMQAAAPVRSVAVADWAIPVPEPRARRHRHGRGLDFDRLRAAFHMAVFWVLLAALAGTVLWILSYFLATAGGNAELHAAVKSVRGYATTGR